MYLAKSFLSVYRMRKTDMRPLKDLRTIPNLHWGLRWKVVMNILHEIWRAAETCRRRVQELDRSCQRACAKECIRSRADGVIQTIASSFQLALEKNPEVTSREVSQDVGHRAWCQPACTLQVAQEVPWLSSTHTNVTSTRRRDYTLSDRHGMGEVPYGLGVKMSSWPEEAVLPQADKVKSIRYPLRGQKRPSRMASDIRAVPTRNVLFPFDIKAIQQWGSDSEVISDGKSYHGMQRRGSAHGMIYMVDRQPYGRPRRPWPPNSIKEGGTKWPMRHQDTESDSGRVIMSREFLWHDEKTSRRGHPRCRVCIEHGKWRNLWSTNYRTWNWFFLIMEGRRPLLACFQAGALSSNTSRQLGVCLRLKVDAMFLYDQLRRLTQIGR